MGQSGTKFLKEVKLTDYDPEKLKAIFDKYDKNKSGKLEQGQAKKFLTDYATAIAGKAPTPEEVDELFQKLDTDTDGSLTFVEVQAKGKEYTSNASDIEGEVGLAKAKGRPPSAGRRASGAQAGAGESGDAPAGGPTTDAKSPAPVGTDEPVPDKPAEEKKDTPKDAKKDPAVLAQRFINAAKAGKGEWVEEYKYSGDKKHQCVVFVKPECTNADEGVALTNILELVFSTLKEKEVDVKAIRILTGPELEQSGMMTEHYGVISKISKEGESSITSEASEKLKAYKAENKCEEATVMGAHQFLAAILADDSVTEKPTAETLQSWNVDSIRLAGGTYAIQHEFNAKQYVLLNVFHPSQLVPYTSSGRGIIVLECLSDVAWASLRTDICGATDPSKAKEGSVRQKLLAGKEALKMKSVDTSNNGVHMSAGPLEASTELSRFFGPDVAVASTRLGVELLAAGASEEQVASWMSNAKVTYEGKEITAFDLTEEVDLADAVAKLMSTVSK